MEVLAAVSSSTANLMDQALECRLETADGRASGHGKHHAGCVTVTIQEAQPLLTGASAPKAELIAFTQGLELLGGKNVNIYTDSLSSHIWEERGLLTSNSKDIKQDIHKLHSRG
jgi:hypothetical protein